MKINKGTHSLILIKVWAKNSIFSLNTFPLRINSQIHLFIFSDFRGLKSKKKIMYKRAYKLLWTHILHVCIAVKRMKNNLNPINNINLIKINKIVKTKKYVYYTYIQVCIWGAFRQGETHLEICFRLPYNMILIYAIQIQLIIIVDHVEIELWLLVTYSCTLHI